MCVDLAAFGDVLSRARSARRRDANKPRCGSARKAKSLRGVRVEPLRGEVVVWKVSVRSIAAAISEACKVKRRLPHEYPPQKRKSLLTHARRITDEVRLRRQSC